MTPRPIYALPPRRRPFWGLAALNDRQHAIWLMGAVGAAMLLAAATVVCAHLLHAPDEAHVSAHPGAWRTVGEWEGA